MRASSLAISISLSRMASKSSTLFNSLVMLFFSVLVASIGLDAKASLLTVPGIFAQRTNFNSKQPLTDTKLTKKSNLSPLSQWSMLRWKWFKEKHSSSNILSYNSYAKRFSNFWPKRAIFISISSILTPPTKLTSNTNLMVTQFIIVVSAIVKPWITIHIVMAAQQTPRKILQILWNYFVSSAMSHILESAKTMATLVISTTSTHPNWWAIWSKNSKIFVKEITKVSDPDSKTSSNSSKPKSLKKRATTSTTLNKPPTVN